MNMTLVTAFSLVFLGIAPAAFAEGDGHHGHGDDTTKAAGHHDHGKMTAWEGTAPQLALELTPDMGTNLNLHITADGFTFAPEQVNGPVTTGTGHAHVYVNGTKVARAYGPWMHLENVPEGAVIRVTLNANDHSAWAVDGTILMAEVTAR